MVKGLAALHRRFAAIPDRIKDAVTKPMEAYAEQIVTMMRHAVPVDQGDLSASIGWTWGDAPKGSVTVGSVGAYKYDTIRITIFAGGADKTKRSQARASGTLARDQKRSGDFETDNAKFQEFGTQNMPANPYFYVSWRANRRRVKAGITRAVRKAIKES